MPTERITILGVPIDNPTPEERTQLLKKFLAEPTPHHITTPNPEFLVEAQRNPAFRTALEHAALNIGDGVGLQYAALLQGKHLTRTPGVDLLDELAQLAAREGKRLYLLGGLGDTAQRAAATLNAHYPQLTVAGAESGGVVAPTGEGTSAMLDAVAAAKPEILLVAFGHPKQELWLHQNLPHLPSVRIGIGVGGAFDYLAGTAKRAPTALRRLGLEWLYRLIRQPWRWKRIFTAVIVFPLAILTEPLRRRTHP